MATPIFDFGDLVRVSAVFLDSTASAINPTTTKFQYYAEALAVTTTYTYGSDAALVRDSTGHFHVDIDTNESSGVIKWRFYSTGTGQAAQESSFYVRPRQW